MTERSLETALQLVASALDRQRCGEQIDTEELKSALETLKAWRTISGFSEAMFLLVWILPPLLFLYILDWLGVWKELVVVTAAAGSLAMIPWGLRVRMITERILQSAGATRQQISDANSLLRVATLYFRDETKRI